MPLMPSLARGRGRTTPPEAHEGPQTLESALLLLLSRQGRRVPIPVFLAAAMIAAIAAERLPRMLWLTWLSVVAVVLATRWVLLARLPQLEDFTDSSKLRIAVALSAVNGVTHALSLFFFPFLTEAERVIQSMVLLGLCAGSVATTAGYWPVFLAYAIPVLGPLALLWALSPGISGAGLIERWISVLIILLGTILVGLARDAFRLFRESFEIRLQQVALNQRLEAALAQAEEANRAKTRFLAAASHDLRQPMHALAALGAALGSRPLDPQSLKIAAHMDAALQGLTIQLDSLLDISKLDAGVVQVHWHTVHLNDILRRLQDDCGEEAAAKGLRLEIQTFDRDTVVTDELQLERVVRNLVDNAIKYTDHGTIELRLTGHGDTLALKISDTGRGIPAEEQSRIFEEFYQLDNPERDRAKGLGLGLAIVRRLVELLGIELKLESTVGRGTVFTLEFPTTPHVVEDVSLESTVPKPATAGHVMVIDDEAAIRIGMQELLQARGYRTTIVDGTAEAVAAARSERPDVVLADFRLRGGDSGIASIRAVRELYPDMRAVLISGDTAADRVREARDAHITLLRKPVPAKVLTQVIDELLREVPNGG